MKYKNKYTIESHIPTNITHKKQKYVIRISNGRNKKLSISVLQLFRNVLRIVKTRAEFKKYVKVTEIKINGRLVKIKDIDRRPIAVGEYIEYGQGIKLVCIKNCKISLVPAGGEITYGYRSFTMVKNGKYQINLYHNYNIVSDTKPSLFRNSTVIIQNKKLKEFKSKNYILLNGRLSGNIITEAELKKYVNKFKKLKYYGVSLNEKN